MADEINNNDNVLVEFAENNIVLLDPNKVLDSNGKPQDRLVNQENLTIYANLQARVVPRSKVITGAGMETESLVDVFEGKINFLKPGGKQYMTDDWADTQTGGGNQDGPYNQKVLITKKDPFTGQDYTKEGIQNRLDDESFGISSINVTYDRSYIPQVNMTFIDVRGKTLFEQGQNSAYAVFFNLPYPLFLLTLKGYYGKAVQYQLMLRKFNANFDPETGNYTVTCDFVGRIAALLADINVAQLLNAPYMYARSYSVTNVENDDVDTFSTTKGYQTLNEVFLTYKRNDLIPSSLPHLTLRELASKAKTLEESIEKALKKQNLKALDDIDQYERILNSYLGKIMESGGWRRTYMDVGGLNEYLDEINGVTSYSWKKEYQDDLPKRESGRDKLKKEITEHNQLLLANPTFGSNGPQAIPIDITYQDFTTLPPEGRENNGLEWFVFEGTPTSFDKKISDIFTKFGEKRQAVEQNLTHVVNEVIESEQGLGFRPTVRNLFGIVIANADTFLRLMNDVHIDAMGQRNNPDRLNAIKSAGKGTTSSELPEDNFIYPWPHYYVREENEDGGSSFVTTYPGAVKVLSDTKGYKGDSWPEVEFVEEYLKASTIKDTGQNQFDFGVSIMGENWVPTTSFDTFETQNYQNPNEIDFSYEIWDRSTVHGYFSGLQFRYSKNTSDFLLKNIAKFESITIQEKSKGFFDLQELLKNQTWSYNTFLEYLQTIAPLTDYQLLVRDEYNTPYLRDQILGSRFKLYPLDVFTSLMYQSQDIDVQEQIGKMQEALLTQSVEDNIMDTYPLADFDLTQNEDVDSNTGDYLYGPWAKINLANGHHLPSKQDLNKISNSLVYGTAPKTFTSLLSTAEGLEENICITPPHFYCNAWWTKPNMISDYSSTLESRTIDILNNAVSWKNFFEEIHSRVKTIFNPQTNPNTASINNGIFLTEGSVDYSEIYVNGQTYENQITSMLNTPYFTNAVIEGVFNEINNVPNPYISASYLFLNSLPLSTLKELTIKQIKEDAELPEFGDYIFATLNQLSAVHPLPYAWILKYGSVWHRYKNYVKNGVDILDSVWTNFDANKYFNDTSGLINQYQLNIGENSTQITFAGDWNIGGNFRKINVGFYPELNNIMHYFVTGDLLYNSVPITGVPVTSNEINNFINIGALNVKHSTDLDISPPQNATQGDVNCQFWYTYYDTSRDVFTTGYTPQYILYPSGAIKKEQLSFEVDPFNLTNNPVTHNGNARFCWGMSNYGYFEHSNNSKPAPTQYLKKINNLQKEQQSFHISSLGDYSGIEEVLDVFSPDILDVFEEYFLNFAQKDGDFNPTLNAFSASTPNSLYIAETTGSDGGTNFKTFQSILRNIMTVSQTDVEPASTATQFGYNLAKTQLNKTNRVLSTFLSESIAFNFYNQQDINVKALRTFVGDQNYYDFGTYQGNLPPDIPFATSEANYPQEWQALYLNVGFLGDDQHLSLVYGDYGSEVTDFFRELNIDFTVSNIQLLRKVIKIYVTERVRNGSTSNSFNWNNITSALTPVAPPANFNATFIQKIKDEIVEKLDDGQYEHINQLFLNLKKDLPTIPNQGVVDDFKNESAIQSDELKLDLYNTFRVINDKWISGEEIERKLIFEDFLFLDIANRDIGDTAILGLDAFKSLTNPSNGSLNLLGLIGSILDNQNFNFLPLPSYINFYGVTSDGAEYSKYNTTDEANSLFGTHLEVDYLESSPKFLCQYVGETSSLPDVKNPINRYNSDSFLLGRTADNPLFSNCSDPKKWNKVMSFAVDFGIENQQIFKGVNLDTSDTKPTAESFVIEEQLAQSANDKSIMTQGLNLFNVYRTRSYTCKVSALGNVCIQPTMYFSLRNVPMFTGPYLIQSVEHSIQPNTMTTTFEGVRVPFHRLPNVENFVAKLAKSFVKKVRDKQKASERQEKQGGFHPEGDEQNEKGNAKATPFSGPAEVKAVIIHVTAGLDYGAEPVQEINRQHKNRDFSGIGYHYLISRGTGGSKPDGSIYEARPTRYRGAHTRGANAYSISISMIADCDTMGTYTSSGEYPTLMQKDSMEDLTLYLMFKYGLLQLRKDSAITGQYNLWIEGSAGPKKIGVIFKTGTGAIKLQVPSQDWGLILYGHNEFANKRCPCFRMKNALAGQLGKNLNEKLFLRTMEIFLLLGAPVSDQHMDGDTVKPSSFLSNMKPGTIPSPYEGTDNFDGVGQYVNSN